MDAIYVDSCGERRDHGGDSTTVHASCSTLIAIGIEVDIACLGGEPRIAVLGGFSEKHEDGVTQRNGAPRFICCETAGSGTKARVAQHPREPREVTWSARRHTHASTHFSHTLNVNLEYELATTLSSRP